MKGKFWSEEEDAKIRELRAAGVSWAGVGAALRRDPVACANRWYRLRHGDASTAAAFWTPEEDDLLREEWRGGEPEIGVLAWRLGRSESAVVQRARDLRLMSRLSRRAAGDGSSVRRCHDCGRETHDYRCPACLRRWRSLHGASGSGGEEGV